MAEFHPPSRRADFKIAIICALPREFDAVALLFDRFWDEDGHKLGRAAGDTNHYTTGRIGAHDVVLVVLPNMGKAGAAAAAASFRLSYNNLKLALLVGICGGVPKIAGNEALLGDVVISETVVQYDFGRQYAEKFVRKDTVEDNLGRANKDIRGLIKALETARGRRRLEDKAAEHLEALQRIAKGERGSANYQYPGVSEDKLFASDYDHKHQGLCDLCTSESETYCDKAAKASCAELGCDERKLVVRKRLQARQDMTEHDAQRPGVFIGRIASGDGVEKSGKHRDEIAQAEEVIAFEMEGAGVWDEIPSIIVKGICDYADSHKNKKWQDFAAATAASVAKALLERYTLNDIDARPGPDPNQTRTASGNRSISHNSFGNNSLVNQGDVQGNVSFGVK
ncbi:hypothetical protein CGCF413_v015564 [Colletotrichum fructicola]|nr:hypothetical protein CGCF413_v015564 [Colletotrichum fructicola]